VVLTLSDVLFDTDEADLKPGAGSAIAQLAELLDEYPDRRLRIEGHTDSRGSDAYNRELSKERAAAIADALTNRGVSRSRLEIVGMGEAYPVATNETAAGRQQNRRVEIVISEPDGDFPAVTERAAVTRNR
jgi:outer membrane protein OmpA-like peptidoglycan-associated protein